MVRRWKFTALLLALMLLLVVHPLIGRDSPYRIVTDLLLALVFLNATIVLFQQKKSRVTALALGIPSIVGIFFGYVVPGVSPFWDGIIFHVMPVIFLTYCVFVILRTIFVDRSVSADSINGAFCGYLLLGLAFGHVYSLVELFHPGSFFLHEHFGVMPTDDTRRHSLLTYFSLVTMTTLGYGDILPKSAAARSIATLEVMIGQFYVAAIIAELIGLKVSAAIMNPQPGKKHPGVGLTLAKVDGEDKVI